MPRIFSLAALVVAGLAFAAVRPVAAGAAEDSRRADPPAAVVERPGGDYEHVWLSFAGGERPIEAFMGCRAGRAATVWFLGGTVPGGRQVSGNRLLLVDSATVNLTPQALRGQVDVRQVTVWAPMKLHAAVALTIDATRTGDTISGSWSSIANGEPQPGGAVEGKIVAADTLRDRQAFDPQISWPSYHGGHGTNRGTPSRAGLVDTLRDARPVWKSEERLLTGWGNGTDDRYPQRAAFGTVCGGAGSPIFADGRIYLFHYRPAGEPQPPQLAAALERFEKDNKREPAPLERDALVAYARAEADTIVVCLDACTGGVVWRTTFPRMSGNYQTHKWRGFNPTAARIGPAVIANDYANNWVALEAQAGTVLWTIPRGTRITKDSGALGAVAAGGLAILPGLGNEPSLAVEPASGRVVWQEPGGPQAHVFGSPGQERVVFLGGPGGPTCRDAATGRELWKMSEPVVGSSASAGLVDGSTLVAHVWDPDATKRGGHFRGWRLSDDGPTAIWEDAFLPFDENLTVTIGAGRAYLVGRNTIRVLDVATGRRLAERTFDPQAATDAGGVGSNQWLGIVGDRLFLSPEGQHGRQSLVMLDAETLQSRGDTWVPPNNTTTAYGRMSIAFPVIDGRVVVRGSDGLFLYDLRKP